MSEIIELPPLPEEPENGETNYKIWFAFKENADDKQFTQATTTVTTEKPVGSLEEVNEVSREIGKANGYAQLYIVLSDPPFDNLDEILESARGTFGQMKEGTFE